MGTIDILINAETKIDVFPIQRKLQPKDTTSHIV